MKKLVILILLVAPFVYAYNKKPLLEAHERKLYLVAKGEEASADVDVTAMPEWEGLEFRDWLIVTATQDKEKHSLVSYGIVNYIKVVDADWAPKAFGLKPREPEEKK